MIFYRTIWLLIGIILLFLFPDWSEKMDTLTAIREKKAFISDMDGVIYRGTSALPGAKRFIEWLKRLGCRREEAVIIGDRMDTEIIAGIESEIQTVLVLSGITQEPDIERFAYRPGLILDDVGQIAE
jgi:ribonucleotide monophosphatase NagD (HAD superfamily)